MMFIYACDYVLIYYFFFFLQCFQKKKVESLGVSLIQSFIRKKGQKNKKKG